MLGTDKSRGYCLEMICADFLAGAHLVADGKIEGVESAADLVYGRFGGRKRVARADQKLTNLAHAGMKLKRCVPPPALL